VDAVQCEAGPRLKAVPKPTFGGDPPATKLGHDARGSKHMPTSNGRLIAESNGEGYADELGMSRRSV